MQVNKPAIKQFIRDSLGCTCPDEVFGSINVEQNPGLVRNAKTEYLLTIGDKLVVYMIEPNEWTVLCDNLQQIFDWGRRRRDAAELNRFRLVVCTQDIHSAKGALFQCMESLPGLDERLHLHVILPENLPQLTIL